jgi:hypothetical protein
MGCVGLALVVGPAHAGKVALLLDRFLEVGDRDPWLVVPNRSDIERVERDLIQRAGVLLSGTIGTFDDLFAAVCAAGGPAGPVLTDSQRSLVLRRAVQRVSLTTFSASAALPGFDDALGVALGELDAGLIDARGADDELSALHRAYSEELRSLGFVDRHAERRRAVDLLRSDLRAWGGSPVLAYGFEDLTGAEWALLEGLAARTEVCVSLPYEPGRPVFASLERTASDLAGLASDVRELPPQAADCRPEALAYLERELFGDRRAQGPPLEGSLRFVEGAGTRGTAELVAEEIVSLLRAGVPAEAIGVVCASSQRARGALDTAFAALEIPSAFELRRALGETPLGRALVGLLRYAWLEGSRADLFTYLRSPYSGLARSHVDFLEGRLRGRGLLSPARVDEALESFSPGVLAPVLALREADALLEAVARAVESMLRAAHGEDDPPVDAVGRRDLRASDAALRELDGLAQWESLVGELRAREIVALVERCAVSADGVGEPGRVVVVDLARARTRTFDFVFVLGLEEGSFPRRSVPSPFIDDDARRALGGRLARPDQVSRDRYLFYTACTRATRRLYLVREAAGDDGVPREESPFWGEVVALFDPDDVRSWTRSRSLSSLTWPIEVAPSERERLRALALLSAWRADDAAGLARANGWQRRLERARTAFTRETQLRNPVVLEQLASRQTFAVTELERFADCSAAWLVDRVIAPRTIDAEIDAMRRGIVAHTALQRFGAGLPREIGADRVTPETVEAAVALMRRCVDESLESGVRFDATPIALAELRHTLHRDLEAFVRDEAEWGGSLYPYKFEVGFGSDRAAPHMQRGLQLAEDIFLSGKIDRIDRDPFGARGIVQDYKSGKGAHSAKQIAADGRLQIPLYMLVLRDLAGLEPLGGVYRALAGGGDARGMLRSEARDDLPSVTANDFLDEQPFWEQVESARAQAVAYARRIRAGEVSHDPRGGDCPSWCDLWTMCRVRRG